MMLARSLCLLALVGLLPMTSAAQTYRSETPIAGDVVPVEVALAQGAEGVDVTISIEPGSGDVLGFFANLVDETLLPSLSVLDESGLVTDARMQANAVSQVGGGNNLNPLKRWDIGVRLGHSGSADGAITTARFTLRSDEVLLTPALLTGADNEGFVFGVRIQSTGGGEGSSKMGLVVPVTEAAIEITSPVDGALLNVLQVDVAGLVSGANAVDVTAASTVPAGIADGMFLAPSVPLEEGLNTIVATAITADGAVMDQVQVRVDTTPPVVAIFEPEDGSLTTDSLTFVLGQATDESGISEVRVNGEPVELDEIGTFATETFLSVGENLILVEAVDAAGNVGTAEVIVTRMSGDAF